MSSLLAISTTKMWVGIKICIKNKLKENKIMSKTVKPFSDDINYGIAPTENSEVQAPVMIESLREEIILADNPDESDDLDNSTYDPDNSIDDSEYLKDSDGPEKDIPDEYLSEQVLSDDFGTIFNPILRRRIAQRWSLLLDTPEAEAGYKIINDEFGIDQSVIDPIVDKALAGQTIPDKDELMLKKGWPKLFAKAFAEINTELNAFSDTINNFALIDKPLLAKFKKGKKLNILPKDIENLPEEDKKLLEERAKKLYWSRWRERVLQEKENALTLRQKSAKQRTGKVVTLTPDEQTIERKKCERVWKSKVLPDQITYHVWMHAASINPEVDNEEWSERNVIPRGNFYHKDKGWY